MDPRRQHPHAERAREARRARVQDLPHLRDRSLRGRTRRGRLRLLDRWLLERESALLQRTDGVVVDVGIGGEPWTTLDLVRIAAAPLVAIDVDPARVELARARGIDARVGDLTIGFAERAILVRAMNVLRGQPERADAHAILAAPLVEDGLLLEGTSDAQGAVVTAWALRSDERRLLFLTDFSRGFAPALFWDHLPRDLRRDARPGTAIRDLLDRWTNAFADRAPRGTPADAFRSSADAVARPGDVVGESFFELCWPP